MVKEGIIQQRDFGFSLLGEKRNKITREAIWKASAVRTGQEKKSKHCKLANPTPTRPGIIPCGKQPKNMQQRNKIISWGRRFTHAWVENCHLTKGMTSKHAFNLIGHYGDIKVIPLCKKYSFAQSRCNNIQAILKSIGPVVILFHALLIFPWRVGAGCGLTMNHCDLGS